MANSETNPGNITTESSLAGCVNVKWKIPGFFSLPEAAGYSLDSPLFIFANAKWCIRLYPNGKTDVSCHELICKFGIIKGNGEYCNNCDMYDMYFYPDYNELDNITYAGDIPKKSEMAEDKEAFAPEGTLVLAGRIFCEAAVGNELFLKASNKVDSNWTLCQDFKNLLLGGESRDLTLKVKDKELRAHRDVLIARSQVFRSMLTHDMVEKNSGVIDVPDCEPEAMEQLLLHLYCGKVDNLNKNNMLSLYYAADKYDLKFLKEECCDFIKISLSSSNICDVLKLAMRHSDRGLLECAADYFVVCASRILTTTEWLTFMKENCDVANDLLIRASRKWASKLG